MQAEVSGNMKFPFIWMVFLSFTSTILRVVRHQTEQEYFQVTAKGCKQLAGGRRVHLIVAIAYSKGVILKVPYEKMNGTFFAAFVREHLNISFAKAGPKTNGR